MIEKWMLDMRGFYGRGENCRQLSLLTWNSFIDQFILQVGGEGMR